MKEIVSASLAQQSFLLEQDAYMELKRYLEDVADRLEEGDQETLSDIEDRMAEIFRRKLSSPMMVVTLRMVREGIERMGRPSTFGEPRHSASSSRRSSQEAEEAGHARPSRLYRSLTNRSIAGVCGGVADYLGCDVTLLRLLTLLLILFGGLSIWVYVVLWIIIPEEQSSSRRNRVS